MHEAGPDQEAPYGGLGQLQPFPLGQQFGQLSVVDAAIVLPGQDHHWLLDSLWSGVGRHPAPVLMHQSPPLSSNTWPAVVIPGVHSLPESLILAQVFLFREGLLTLLTPCLESL
jgi:hypothetical protein